VLSLSRSVAGLVVTGVIGFVAFTLFAWIERGLIPWQPRER
jgi:ABC-type nitrate/sulfonate/bicarbonate transport system permease component